jgi:hypothetical protein
VNTPKWRAQERGAPRRRLRRRRARAHQSRFASQRSGMGERRPGNVRPVPVLITSFHFSSTPTPDTINTGTPQSDVRSSSRASATCGPASTGRVSIERGAGSASPPLHKSARGQNAGAGGTTIMARTESRIRHTLGSMFLPEGFPQVYSRAPTPDQCQRL